MATFLSEEELIAALEAKGTYVVRKKDDISPPPTSTPKPVFGDDPLGGSIIHGSGRGRGRGARKKESVSPPTPVHPATAHHALSGIGDMSQYRITPAVPKISFFSGDDQKGDVTYMEWRFEVRCLASDPDITPSILVQAIRRSLRGTARTILVSLGDKATTDSILLKLDALFDDVSSKGMLMQEFFNSAQRPDESVTSFGCRLDTLLQKAVEHGHLALDAKNDLLRHKFWTSLSSERLKGQTRHKYDTVMDFDTLLREIRIVEKELSVSAASSSTSPSQPSRKQTSHQPVVVDDKMKEFEEKFDKKLDSLEKRINDRVEGKFDQILQKLDQGSDSRNFQNFRPRNNNNNRPYSRNTGYNNTRQQHQGQRNNLNGQMPR